MNESQQLSANSREPWHKRLHIGWFDLCEITERAALQSQEVDQCLPRARGSGTGSDCSESKNVSRWWKHSVWWLWWWLHCCKSLSEFLFCTPKCGEFIVYKYTPIKLTKRKKKRLMQPRRESHLTPVKQKAGELFSTSGKVLEPVERYWRTLPP